MKVILQPIVHKDEYDRLLEDEVLGYFKEAIFDPLFEILGEEMRVNADDDWVLFPPEYGSLGIARKDLPQIKSESRGAMIQFIQSWGVTYQEEEILPNQLRPSQEGYYAAAVERGRKFVRQEGPAILVSSDGYAVDGHHRWMAAMLEAPDKPVRILRFSLPVQRLIEIMWKFPGVVRENAEPSAIEAALMAGTIWYAGDRFYGTFNAAISRALRALGATKGENSFILERGRMPVSLQFAIVGAKQRSDFLHGRVAETLLTMAGVIGVTATGIQFAKTVDIMVTDLQKQFVRSVSGVSGLPEPTATPEELKEAMKQQITQGTDLAIKNFTAEATTELRAEVLRNLQEGGRPDRLAEIIQAKWGVAKRKARVIAESETSIAVSGFREKRYRALGSESYIWQTSEDSKVRPTHGESNNHRVLNGRTFSWSSPPIVDPATGRRRHPGQDYGPCRCVALPVLNVDA